MWGWGMVQFLILLSKALMPVGGPTVQLNLDTVYPDLESDFTA